MASNLETFPGYKPSGVDWLGDVPAHRGAPTPRA